MRTLSYSLILLALAQTGFGSEFAITIDDFMVRDSAVLSADAKNDAILAALKKHKIKAALFVTSGHLSLPGARARLAKWDKAGHMIANHTHTHPNYHDRSFEDFSADVLKAEKELIRYGSYQKFFRFPMLKAGDTKDKRDRIRAFMKVRGYKNGYVTIDTSDWFIDSRLGKALEKDPKRSLIPYKDYYLKHMWANALLYDNLARRVLGRGVKHTLLLHHNLISALFLDDLLASFKQKGWKPIDADRAFSDPVFTEFPDIVPAGESIIWSLARAHPKFAKETRYPAESAKYERPKMDALGL